jgi:hypothetical protein
VLLNSRRRRRRSRHLTGTAADNLREATEFAAERGGGLSATLRQRRVQAGQRAAGGDAPQRSRPIADVDDRSPMSTTEVAGASAVLILGQTMTGGGGVGARQRRAHFSVHGRTTIGKFITHESNASCKISATRDERE